jgi:hypothetical protein
VEGVQGALTRLAKPFAEWRAGQDALGSIPVLVPDVDQNLELIPMPLDVDAVASKACAERRSRTERAALREGNSAEAMWVSDIQVLRCEDLNAPHRSGFSNLLQVVVLDQGDEA